MSLEPPDAVLLEVRGSLRLFGGSRRLCERLRAELQAAGLEPQLSLTPTPLASLWMARAGKEGAIRHPADAREPARGSAAPLHPLARTQPRDARHDGRADRSAIACVCRATVLRGVSSHRCSTCSIARSAVGRIRATVSSRVNGSRPDAISSPRSRTRRASTRPARLCSTSSALFCAKRRCSVQSLELRLVHREAPPTRLRLRFVEPVAEARRIAELLSERLARIALPAPVRALRLRSGPLVESREASTELFAMDRRQSGAGVPQLIERLRARLGTEAVYGLCLVPEHRPESAWRVAEPALPAANAEPRPASEAGMRAGQLPRESRCGCSPSRSCSTAASSRASKACSSSSRGRSASRAAGGTAATSSATTTSPAIRRVCGSGCSAIAQPAGRWFLHGVFG